MQNQGYYTVEGVNNYLAEDCARKLGLEQKLRTLFGQAAFKEIESSGLVYFDAYTKNGNFAQQEQLIKTQDESGRLLVLRYDGTVSAAGLAATSLKHEPRPLRLSYIGRMYRFGETGGGRLKEFTQAGLELIGSSAVSSDAEMIALSIRSLQVIGFDSIMLSIGEIRFMRLLLESYGLSSERIDRLSKWLDDRNEVAIRSYMATESVPAEARTVFEVLLTANGEWEQLDRLRALTEDSRVLAGLDRLEETARLLEAWGFLRYCSLDLTQQGHMRYYSGLIFKAYSYNIGFPLLSGGRYDRAVEAFGEPEAAIGFSLGVDLCLQALARQGADKTVLPPTRILIVRNELAALAWQALSDLREGDQACEMLCVEDECLKDEITKLQQRSDRPTLYLLEADGSTKEMDA